MKIKTKKHKRNSKRYCNNEKEFEVTCTAVNGVTAEIHYYDFKGYNHTILLPHELVKQLADGVNNYNG